jgi:phytol kinase
MLDVLIVCVLIFCMLIISEFLWRKKLLSAEVSRKFVHMGTGILVAFLPFFVSWSAIQALSVAFLVVIFVSARFKIFRSIHSVKRVTRGEILYAVGIGVCAFLEPASWIFTVAILHLAVADALAAMVGTKWGRRTNYTILSHGKSLLGSMTFFYASMAIFIGVIVFYQGDSLPSNYLLLIVVPTLLTMLENISWYGLDNVTVPIMAIVLLSNI